MVPYLAVFGTLCWATLLTRRWQHNAGICLLLYIVVVSFVGLRHEIGADWFNYVNHHNKMTFAPISEAFGLREPASKLLFWLAEQSGLGIYLTNFVSILVLFFGLHSVARQMPNTGLALIVAVPYIIVAVGMNLTRQSLALGIVYFVFSIWYQSSVWRKIAMIVLAGAFHYSALLVLPVIFLDRSLPLRERIITICMCVAVGMFVLGGGINLTHYLVVYSLSSESYKDSSGAVLHVMLNAGPAALYFLFRRAWQESVFPSPLMDVLGILSIVSLPLLSLSSTAVDRASLYFSIVPMYVVAGLPEVVKRIGVPTTHAWGAVIAPYFGLLVIWLMFSNHAEYWVPYRSVLF